jgi:hypothetical protein
MDEDEIVRRMDIIASNNELFYLLEECDSQECLYTYEAIMAGSCEYWIENGDNG